MSVVGSAVAILLYRAAKLRHGNQDNVFHAVTHVQAKRRNSARELAEKIRKQRRLIPVVIPATDIRKSHLNAGLPLEQTRELLQVSPQFASLTILRQARNRGTNGREIL